MCKSCYGTLKKNPHAPKRIKVAVCHPDRKHKGKGMCQSCYDRNRRGSGDNWGSLLVDELESMSGWSWTRLAEAFNKEESVLRDRLRDLGRKDLVARLDRNNW